MPVKVTGLQRLIGPQNALSGTLIVHVSVPNQKGFQLKVPVGPSHDHATAETMALVHARDLVRTWHADLSAELAKRGIK